MMRKTLVALFALSLCAAAAWAQGGPPRGSRNYNPATETTVQGSVQEVVTTGRQGVHVVLKTASETLEVHLGPVWYLSQNQFAVAKGDAIEVTGSRVKFGETEAVIARQVRKGDQVLTLRDAQGIPLWAGSRGPSK